MNYEYQLYCLRMMQGDTLTQPLPNIAPVLPQFTLSLWWYVGDTQTVKHLFSQDNGLDLGLSYDKIYATCGTETALSTEPFLPDTWNHIAVTYFCKEIEVFLNGASCLVKKFTASPLTLDKGVSIGKDFFGYLRNVALYSSAMIADDIRSMMYNPVTAQTALIDCSFTQNPPVDLVSGQIISLPTNACITGLAPSATLDGYGYFRLGDDKSRFWMDLSKTFSVQSWLCLTPDNDQSYYVLLSTINTLTDDGFELGLLRSQEGTFHICLYWGDVSTPLVQSTEGISPNTWVNLALTCENKQVVLYLNGIQSLSQMVAPSTGLWYGSMLQIGARNSTDHMTKSHCFHGSLGRIDIWKTALTATQICTYSAEFPVEEMDSLWASMDFFERDVINAVTGIAIGKINYTNIQQREQATALGTAELLSSRSKRATKIPPLPADELKKAREKSGILQLMSENGYAPHQHIVASHPYDNTIYFLCHTQEESYIITTMEDENNDLLVWKIEFILIILESMISYFLSTKITSSPSVAQFIRQNLIVRASIAVGFDNVGADTAITLLSLMRSIFSSGYLTTLLRMLCADITFWTICAFVIGFLRRFISGGAEILIWMSLLTARLAIHIDNYPAEKKSPIHLNSILFRHNMANKIGSIALQKNWAEEWVYPEWTVDRKDENNSPAAYRIARWQGSEDMLAVKACISVVNPLQQAVTYQLRADGGKIFGMSETVTLNCNPGTHIYECYFSFPDAEEYITKGGIQKYDLELSWEYQSNTNDLLGFLRFQLSKHRIYAILDSVSAPWGRTPTGIISNGHNYYSNLPMTDIYEATIGMLAGIQTLDTMKSTLVYQLYHSGKYQYQGGSTLRMGGGIVVYEFVNAICGTNTVGVNCEDCAVLMCGIANMYGASLNFVSQNQSFRLAHKILLIGEQTERWPDANPPEHFVYHCLAVDGALTGATLDCTQVNCYDCCEQFYGCSSNTLILAQGMPLSASQTPSVGALPATDTYVESVYHNSNEGIGQFRTSAPSPLYFIRL